MCGGIKGITSFIVVFTTNTSNINTNITTVTTTKYHHNTIPTTITPIKIVVKEKNSGFNNFSMNANITEYTHHKSTITTNNDRHKKVQVMHIDGGVP